MDIFGGHLVNAFFEADGFQRQIHTNDVKESFCFSLVKYPGPAMQIAE